MVTKAIVIDGAFTIENVSNIQEKMREGLGRITGKSPITLDLGMVSEFDGAGLQLLLAFAQASDRLGAKLKLKNTPENISAALERYHVIGSFAARE